MEHEPILLVLTGWLTAHFPGASSVFVEMFDYYNQVGASIGTDQLRVAQRVNFKIGEDLESTARGLAAKLQKAWDAARESRGLTPMDLTRHG